MKLHQVESQMIRGPVSSRFKSQSLLYAQISGIFLWVFFVSQQISSEARTIFVLHHIPFWESFNATDKSASWEASVLCFCWTLSWTVDEADSLNEGNVRYCCTNTKVLSSWYKLGRKQLLYKILCFYLYLVTFQPSLKDF